MILENEKERFLYILKILNKECKGLFTQKELAQYLNVSRPTIANLQNGKSFDFWLLCRYGDLLGIEIKFNYYETKKSNHRIS